jgi:hypothetical protein
MGLHHWDDGRGRVGITAMANLCLEFYYRYQRLEDSGK